MPAVKGWQAKEALALRKLVGPSLLENFVGKKQRRSADRPSSRSLDPPSLQAFRSLLRLPALSKLLYLFCQEGTLFESEEEKGRERVGWQRKQLILQGKRQKKQRSVPGNKVEK